MKKWWQSRKKGEVPCAFGLVALLLSWLLGSTTVYPSRATVEAILAGNHAPLGCQALPEYWIGFILAISALALFLRGGLKGESENRYIGFIGAGLSAVFVIGLGLMAMKASLSFARWQGWMN